MPEHEPAATWENLFFPPARYTYFRRSFEDAPASGSLRAAWMGDAAVLAYGRSGKTRFTRTEMDGIFAGARLRCEYLGNWFSAAPTGTQGYFASNERFGVLAFRGTETDDLTDTLTDLRFLMCKDRRRDPFLGDQQALVHSGFSDALNEVWQDACRLISDFRKLHPGAPLFFTGHSLGAALATLSFTRAALAGTCLYTLGCPRVGNAAYCTLFDGRESYRIMDGNDVVTRVPPEEANYSHPPGPIIQVGAPANGNAGVLGVLEDLFKNPLQYLAGPPDALADHSTGRYCYFLWKQD